jgi:CheY-like chemotaxis protein
MASLVLPPLLKRRRTLRAAGPGKPRPGGGDRANPDGDPRQAIRAGGARNDVSRDGFLLLIVDDDPLMTDMLPRRMRKMLRADVEIRTAATAEEAFDLIRTLRPDVVLSDYNLRQAHTGLDVLRETYLHAPNAARILFSGHAKREIIGIADGDFDAYVEKPMRLDDLIPPVLDAIERATGEDLRGGAPRG